MEKIYTKISPKIALPSETTFELETWGKNQLLSGIDEVGRGCLAGPVVACCLVLKPYKLHPLLRDSKILTENQRMVAAQWIKLNSWYGIGIIPHTIIDRDNIYQATKQAMRRAYYQLVHHPELPMIPSTVIIDAMPLSFENNVTVHSFTKGEQRSACVAAASIIAKVTRDALMQRIDSTFSGYGFASNKGYGSAPIHQQALHSQGPCLIHRKTFLSSFLSERVSLGDSAQQTSLFC